MQFGASQIPESSCLYTFKEPGLGEFASPPGFYWGGGGGGTAQPGAGGHGRQSL